MENSKLLYDVNQDGNIIYISRDELLRLDNQKKIDKFYDFIVTFLLSPQNSDDDLKNTVKNFLGLFESESAKIKNRDLLYNRLEIRLFELERSDELMYEKWKSTKNRILKKM